MSIIRYIRIIFILMALFMGAASEAWADTNIVEGDIVFNAASGGSVAVAKDAGNNALIEHLTGGDKGWKVTIKVTPDNNKMIRKDKIKVQKLKDPSSISVRSRAPEIAQDLHVEGPSVVLGSTSGNFGTYFFVIPEGYEGALVSVTFDDASEGMISQTTNLGDSPSMSASYILVEDITASVVQKLYEASQTTPFTGTFEGLPKADGTFPKITGLTHPLFETTAGNAIIRNVMLTGVNISSSATNVGALVGEAKGNTRIYNCGILPSYIKRKYDEKEYKVVIDRFYEGSGTSISSGDYVGSSANNSNVGSLVGKLTGGTNESPRVINCFSYATITSGTKVAGIVGYIGDTEIKQSNVGSVPMVMNCMFYGEITGGNTIYPVYGGAMIKNEREENSVGTGVNPYNYFRKNANFDNSYTSNISQYNRSWPAEEKNLTRFEYYRSILNSNRRLCTWWVEGTSGTAATDAKVEEVGIAKWVLDPSIAPYPILKQWGKYPSVINRDKTQVWNPKVTKTGTPGNYTYSFDPQWVNRDFATPYEGKKLGTLTVTINPGVHKASHVNTKNSVSFIITDIDTLNHDYGYYKIQLPYYNEEFGDPTSSDWDRRYGGNYKTYVVTGWEITSVTGGTEGTLTNYNFADRNCTAKDNGRVFAQGGYYYVPEEVTAITITAHWGKAVYLANRNYSVDNVKLTPGGQGGYKSEAAFTPAGTIAGTLNGGLVYDENATPKYTFQGQPVYNDWQDAIAAVETSTDNSNVYNQAIVLISNHQVKNGSTSVAGSAGNWRPFTIMSADFDLDNEPDYCFELQFRHDVDRPGIQPVRFDFLPVVELGLAVRHNNLAYAIGVFVPQGHFEITETVLMHTTQFEWDTGKSDQTGRIRMDDNSPVILNGGEFEQLAVRYGNGNRTSYFLLGGNLWFHRFAPGFHPNKNTDNNPTIRLCPVNVIGGDFPEFYLSGLYRPDKAPYAQQGNPYCYTNGGHFGIMAGAGYEKINGDVTFKIDHSVIGEFYGGGINGSKPIGGKIDVTINNSYVDFYCGGPKVGVMNTTVTTRAEGTTFGVYYGAGNGGNSYYRQLQNDGDKNSSTIASWSDNDYKFGIFNPVNNVEGLTSQYDDNSQAGQTGNDKKNENKGYHAEYEFEVFNQSNGLVDQITKRGFIRWIQFGLTETGDVSNTLNDCIINTNFFGGGNRGNVKGNVTSILDNTQIKGNVFGAGYSASIPTFKVHDKSLVTYPSIDKSGTLTNGEVLHGSIVYEWTNDYPKKGDGSEYSNTDKKNNPTFSEEVVENGETKTKWYCYTWNSLENLGVVTGAVKLTLQGETKVGTLVGTSLVEGTGNVYGGGDASKVNNAETPANAYTVVTLKGKTEVYGDVFGGGNEGEVSGSTTVNIE